VAHLAAWYHGAEFFSLLAWIILHPTGTRGTKLFGMSADVNHPGDTGSRGITAGYDEMMLEDYIKLVREEV
jgi:hypothetical protein